MTKLRLSGHTLEIERGRYKDTPQEERYCEYCKSMLGKLVVEDEEHFLLVCPRSYEIAYCQQKLYKIMFCLQVIN